MQCRVLTNTFPEAPGAALHWRHNTQLSGLNIGPFGIVLEPLLR